MSDRPEPSEGGFNAARAIRSFALPAVAALLIWATFVDVPNPSAVTLDASWEQTLGRAFEHGWQFGKDVIFTAGPLGFVTCGSVPRGLFAAALAWQTLGNLFLAAGFVALSGALRGFRRWLFLAALVFSLRWFPDTATTLVMILAVLVWLMRPGAPSWLAAIGVACLAFFAQVKFTYLLTAVAGIGIGGAAEFLRGRWLRGIGIVAGFCLAFVALWLAAGQNPVRLHDYFRYSLEVSRGYPWAMSMDEPLSVFLSGVAVLALNFLFLTQVWKGHPDRISARCAAVFLAFIWLLLWKHGFTRGDHAPGFFSPCLLLALALPGLLAVRRGGWFYLNAALCLAGALLADRGLVVGHALRVLDWPPLAKKALAVLEPGATLAEFDATAAAERQAHRMPAVTNIVKQGTIDLLNYEQGLLLINGLDYVSRPIFQSYSAYTPLLMAKNLRFYQSARAPDFVLVRIGSIDNRYPAQDDALVLAELPRRYEIALDSDDGVLLRKRASPPSLRDFRRELILEQAAGLGATISVPSQRDHALWMQAEFPLSTAGRIRSALYKPPLLFFTIADANKREATYRLIPTIASGGFVLQPLLETTKDYADFSRGIGRKWAETVRFDSEAGESEYWNGGFVRFFRVPELPVTPVDPMKAYVAAGVANIPPVAVVSDVTVVLLADGDLIVHAPGRMEFLLPDGLHRLCGFFGVREGAYTGNGRTDGAEFVVEAAAEDGRVERLWHRLLVPLEREADRGRQPFSVEFPPGVKRLTLRTLPGPRGDTSWDWTYWRDLKFLP